MSTPQVVLHPPVQAEMKVQRHSHKRRESLLMEECLLATGNTASPETHNQHLDDKVSGDEYLGTGAPFLLGG